MNRKSLILILLCIALLSACGIPNPFGNDPLDGTSWELVAIGKHRPIEGSQITISFEGDLATGSSGCNNYGSEYSVRGDKIEFGVLETTLMACADPTLMEQESMFTRFLEEAGQFEIVDERLRIYNAVGEELSFKPEQTSNP